MPAPRPADPATRMDAALADARGVLERVEVDERDAEEARRRYRADGLIRLPADDAVAQHLEPGEGLVARRPSVSMARDGREAPEDQVAGPLYLTTRRLLLLSRVPFAVDLSLIEEVALAGERLLLSLRDGSGIALQAPGPRLLRVEISAALMRARG